MFKRREKPSALRRVGNVFYPEIGLRRWVTYVSHRVGRLPGPPFSIAAGFACGAAISMTPFVGFHFVLSAMVAWIIGANIIAALIGTAVGNPWTFPFIWVWTHNVGTLILGPGQAAQDPQTIDFALLFGELMEETLSLNFAYIVDNTWPLIWPMLVGSLPTALVVWLLFYFTLLRLIGGYQLRRIKRRSRKEARVASKNDGEAKAAETLRQEP